MKFTFLNVLIIMMAITACQPPQKEVAEKPNIVFIMTDDHAYQTLSAYDDRYINTPNLDRLAKDGVLFANSFVANSICGPSRAVMLTGKHSHANGFIDNSGIFNGQQQTFPKLLQKSGYQTAIIGKWHLGGTPTGFDYWNILPGQGSYYNPDFIGMEETVRHPGYVTDLITDFSMDWMDGRDKEKPFCLLVHHKAVHRVWMPDTDHLDEFKDKTYPLPETFYDDYKGRQAAAEQHMSIRTDDMDVVYDLKMADKENEIKTRYGGWYRTGALARLDEAQRARWDAHYDPIIEDFKKAKLSGNELSEWKYQRYMRDYLASVRSLDNNVGRLLDYLEKEGLMDNTLVVYTSDQGFYMGEHGWFDKRFIYEESLRTPLLMHLPKGYELKGEVKEMVQNIDYAPTFMELTGNTVPEDMHGRSLVPLFKKKAKNWRDAIYYHYYEYPNEHMVKRHYGIRTERYKLIHFYFDIDQWELYDLQEDPNEMNNLYGQAEYADKTDDLKAQLKDLMVHYDDQKALKIMAGELKVTE
ncbi:Arylsulfatase A [Saccharicrinis carchari]|uniref:Arylsulfatase A n=1 Tax=Saccharicrinis carchari TaxID=1168039 RepID=A0A521C082_SACCC|nr:sulfatase [Saccharicrinis carchari]SMO52130.1 Arylsulfatase A [Saccharicrinis carchari]